MDIRYYLLCYRQEALVASHLEPEAFGHYMAAGTQKLSRGSVIFAEVDPKLRSDYFRLGDIRQRCVPRADGSPKRSKGKSTKTVNRTPEMNAFYRPIRRGFFVGDQQGLKFYPFPPLRELEVQHAHWWRSASAS